MILPSPSLPRPTQNPSLSRIPPVNRPPSCLPIRSSAPGSLRSGSPPALAEQAKGQQLPGALAVSSLQDSPGPSVVKTGARWSQFS